jgi:hypothetical protein
VQPTRQPGRALLYGPVWGPGRNDWFRSKQASLSSPTRTSHIYSSMYIHTCRYITPREVKCVSVVGLLRAHCPMRGSVGDGWEVARIRVRVIKSLKDRSDSRILGFLDWPSELALLSQQALLAHARTITHLLHNTFLLTLPFRPHKTFSERKMCSQASRR